MKDNTFLFQGTAGDLCEFTKYLVKRFPGWTLNEYIEYVERGLTAKC
jgi:hypothetical protein